jgi:hypothetical protein
MIDINYQLNSTELKEIRDEGLALATHASLDYYLFVGDIYFRIDGSNFDALWGWIPVIDFAFQLCDIAFNIRDGETRKLEFTESEAAILFLRQADNIEIASNFNSSKARVSLIELQEKSKEFAEKLFNDLASRWPALVRNPFFNEKLDIIKTFATKNAKL